MKSIEEFINEKLTDKKILNEYNRQKPYFDLANQVLAYRKMAGLSQIELAEKSNTTQAIISRIENGNSNPSLATIIKIAEAINCKVSISINQINNKYLSSILNKQRDSVIWTGFSCIERSSLKKSTNNIDTTKKELADRKKRLPELA